MPMALGAGGVKVPNFTDRIANGAAAIAAEQGLMIRVADARRPDLKITAERVVAQDPTAGSTARRQRSVRVWLSAGLRASSVPVLTGETERSATQRLQQDNLDLAGVSEIRSQAYPSDLVVPQDPAAKG